MRALAALLVLTAVPASAADRARAALPVPDSKQAGAADVALSGTGSIAVAAAENHAVHVWTHGSAWSSRLIPAARPTAVAVTFAADGKPSVAYAATGGVLVAAPAPRLLARGTADGVQTALLEDGETAVAATLRAGAADRLRLFVGHGSSWTARDLGAVGRGPVQVAPFGRRGLALLYPDRRGQLTVEERTSAATAGRRLRLGVRNGLGALALGPDGGLHVLYGGSTAKEKILAYATLAGSRFSRHTLIGDLQCDLYVVGVGFLGPSVRLVYGYGCDIGWGVYTTAGQLAFNPFRRNANQGPAIAESTARGRLAVLAAVQERGLEVQLFRP